MASTIQRSFAGGELAPSLYARADQVKYATGLRTCRNFVVQRHGGVANRAGTQFICETKYPTRRVRLIRFVFNASQTYTLEFGHLYMRVIRNGVLLEDGGSPYEIATPYDEDHLQDLRFVQSADIVTIVHAEYAPRELRRTGHTSWTLDTITFAPGIDAPANPAAVAVDAGSTAKSFKVTAIKEDTLEESLPSAEASATGSGSGRYDITWDPVAGAMEYYVYKQLNGVYGWIGVANGTSFRDQNYEPDTSRTPPIARNPFDAADKYPATVSYYQQRQAFASTNNEPEKVWMSRPGDFRNFTIRSPLQDDDAVTFTVAGRQVNEVRHLVDVGKLVLLTAGGEWTVEGGQDGVVRPDAINLRQHGYVGSSGLAPILIGNSVLYVQARGSIIRDLHYQLESDGYAGNDLTIFAAHLFDGYTIGDWDYQQTPTPIVWAVRDDGTLLGLTYVREHQIWGWHRHDTDGSYENVCVVPEGAEDATYVVVRREINGSTVRYIERFHSRRVSNIATDAFFVDAGLSYDGRNTDAGHTMTLTGGVAWTYTEDLTLTSSTAFFAAGDVGNEIVLNVGGESLHCKITAYTSGTVVTVQASKDVPAAFRGVAIGDWSRAVDEISGLDHLEGKTVSILADGHVEPQQVVTGGMVTLSRPYSVIHAGLPYEADFETLDMDQPQGQVLTNKKKNITHVTLVVESSRGIWVGPDADHLLEYKQREAEAYGDPVALLTGPADIHVQSNWGQGGRVFVRQSDPLPLSILAVVPSGAVSD